MVMGISLIVWQSMPNQYQEMSFIVIAQSSERKVRMQSEYFNWIRDAVSEALSIFTLLWPLDDATSYNRYSQERQLQLNISSAGSWMRGFPFSIVLHNPLRCRFSFRERNPTASFKNQLEEIEILPYARWLKPRTSSSDRKNDPWQTRVKSAKKLISILRDTGNVPHFSSQTTGATEPAHD